MTKAKKPSAKSPDSPDKKLGLTQAQFQNQMLDILDRLRPVMAEYVEKQVIDEKPLTKLDPMNLNEAYQNLWQDILKRPSKLIDLQLEYWQNIALLAQEISKKFMTGEGQAIIEPEKSDRRFRDALWHENVVFDFIKQSYLLTAQTLQKTVRSAEGLSQHDKQKLDFATRQFIDSLAPTNFALTNPEVLKKTIETKGENLLKGLENLVHDLERGDGSLNIKKTDYSAYQVGKNLAVTEGAVVYQNDLMQLLQYTPSTDTVLQTPLLIVPPWINKYYILDMRPDNSFIKWAVDQGHTVFCISWVNPDKKLAQKDFASYMKEGIIEALNAIELATDQKQANVVGYCIGGTLLATCLAYMTANGTADRIASATFLTTLIDFSEAGDLQVFVDDAQIALLDEKMNRTGFLDGKELRNTFSLLRANDLIWSYVVNNYMLGKEPFPFDLLYWNDDSTNMPAAMHSFYLKNMYRDNLLCKPNRLVLDGQKIDVTRIQTPSYFLSTKEDHIAPWKATYEGMMLFAGEKLFTLSASGHVAGVVNPPASKKYHYWTSDTLDDRMHADQWLSQCPQFDGSWWVHWQSWIEKKSGQKRGLARRPGDKQLKILEKAPGSYVLRKI
jgi:polyhydroxyalkanoate synthase subunit PhaC